MTPPAGILWSFRRCPYAIRARLAIAAAGVDVALREVVLRDKPAEMLAASPKGTVPVLHLNDGRVIDESLDVMHWALDQNDPENWRAVDPTETHALITHNDGPFKERLDRYKYPDRYDGSTGTDARDAARTTLSDLNARLQLNHGSLFPGGLTLADYALFPFVRQFAGVDDTWFRSQDWPHLITWLDQHLDSDRFAAVMVKHKPWMDVPQDHPFPPRALAS